MLSPKKNSAENKLAQTQQRNHGSKHRTKFHIQEYTEKLSKTSGDRFQSMGQACRKALWHLILQN